MPIMVKHIDDELTLHDHALHIKPIRTAIMVKRAFKDNLIVFDIFINVYEQIIGVLDSTSSCCGSGHSVQAHVLCIQATN